MTKNWIPKILQTCSSNIKRILRKWKTLKLPRHKVDGQYSVESLSINNLSKLENYLICFIIIFWFARKISKLNGGLLIK